MISMVTKKMFFDRKAVVRGVDRATRRVLGRFGAFVRRAAKSSIRKRKRTSAPGKPPSSHAGLLKKLIFFGYDRDLYFQAEGWEKARSLYLLAYQSAPGNVVTATQRAWAAFMIARTHFWKFEFKQARKYYHVVFEKYPQVPWADRALFYNATMVYSNLRDMQEALGVHPI